MREQDRKEKKRTLMGKFGFSDDEENQPVLEIEAFGAKRKEQD